MHHQFAMLLQLSKASIEAVEYILYTPLPHKSLTSCAILVRSDTFFCQLYIGRKEVSEHLFRDHWRRQLQFNVTASPHIAIA